MPYMVITRHAVDRYIERIAPGADHARAIAALNALALQSDRVGVTRAGHDLWAAGAVCLVAKQDGDATVCVTVLDEEERRAMSERPPADPRALRAWAEIVARVEAEDRPPPEPPKPAPSAQERALRRAEEKRAATERELAAAKAAKAAKVAAREEEKRKNREVEAAKRKANEEKKLANIIDQAEKRGAAQERKRSHEALEAERAEQKNYSRKLRDALADAWVALGQSEAPCAIEMRDRIAAIVHPKALADAATRAAG